MYGSHQNNKAISPVILGLLTILTGVLMSLPMMISKNTPLAEKIITPVFFITMSAAATIVARNIGIFKNNLQLTAFYIFFLGGVFGYNTGYWEGFVTAPLLFFAWYNTIIIRKHTGYEWNAIDASICVCIASLLNAYIVILLPVILSGFAIYDKLNKQTLLATILGAIMIYGGLWGVSFIFGYDCELLSYIKSISAWNGITELRFIDIIICCIVAFHIILSYILFYANQYSGNSLFIRKTMHFTYLTLLVSIVIALIFGRAETLVPFICILTSIIFTRRTDNLRKTHGVIILYATTTILILLFIAKNFIFLR